MAESLQKKLQAELEKYQQLQKGESPKMQELERRSEQHREVLGRLQQEIQGKS
ncbi:prefoldin subunit 6-like [Malurus melanocephalus]|uniref:prefoldin subunit 6-like n=1 Tax=Malurus melanocephalus TaxID=175006 RepID=UPI002549A99B|nr:prefoldin subunit 6-like [Malurus melanocephalus]